jgi:cell division protein FtsL
MGGGGSRPSPPPPIIQFYYYYFDIPEDAERRIRDMDYQVNVKTNARNNFQWEVNVLTQNIKGAIGDVNFWTGIRNERQRQIDILNGEIADLNKKIKDLQDKIEKAKQAYEMANQQSKAAQSATTALTAQTADATNKNVDVTDVYHKAIKLQNKALVAQYNEYKTALTRGDVLSEYLFGKDGTFSFVNKILFIFYFALVIILLVVLVFVQRAMPIHYKLMILIGAASYPFLVLVMENYIYNLLSYFYSIIMGEPYRSPN